MDGMATDNRWHFTKGKGKTMIRTTYFRASMVLAAMIATVLVAMLMIQDRAEAGFVPPPEPGICLGGPTLCPPETFINSGPSGTVYVDWASFSFSSSEGGPNFRCSLDGAPFGACPSPSGEPQKANYSGLSDGPHTFQVYAIDSSGMVDSSPASRAWTVDTTTEPPPDTTRPNTTLTSGPWSITSSTANFGFTGSDDRTMVADLRFECRLDSTSESGWLPCISPNEYRDLGDGYHTFEVRAKDAAGNVDDTPASRRFLVDTTPPDTTITSQPSDPSDDATPTFGFSMIDNAPLEAQAVSFFMCRISSSSSVGNWSMCSSPYTLPALSTSGIYTFEVTAYDGWFRPDPDPASYTWTYRAPPDTTIDSGPSGIVKSTTASFGFSSNENDATFECSLDGTPFDSCPSPPEDPQKANYSGLFDGPHTFAVRAKNSAGSAGTQASRTWTVDATAPSAPVITGPAEGSYDTDGNVTISGTAEAGSTVELFEESTSMGTAQTSPSEQWSIDLTGITEEPHSFKARATDSVGNVSAESETRTVIVDATGPTVRRVAPAENATGIAPGANVSALFSEATMDPTSIRANFKLYKKGSTTALAATVTYDADTNRAVLNPRDNLKRGTTYKAVVGAGVRDLAGNTLLDQDPNRAGSQPKVWSFTVRN
jgi:large repetitive protein